VAIGVSSSCVGVVESEIDLLELVKLWKVVGQRKGLNLGTNGLVMHDVIITRCLHVIALASDLGLAGKVSELRTDNI
jgi:hypothetical protein